MREAFGRRLGVLCHSGFRRLTLGHIREEPRSAWASGVGRIINESSARQILHQDFTRSLALEAETGDRMITWQDARNLLCLKRKDMMLPWQMLMQLFCTSGGSRPLDFVKLLAGGCCRCQSSQFPLRIFLNSFKIRVCFLVSFLQCS